MIFPNR